MKIFPQKQAYPLVTELTTLILKTVNPRKTRLWKLISKKVLQAEDIGSGTHYHWRTRRNLEGLCYRCQKLAGECTPDGNGWIHFPSSLFCSLLFTGSGPMVLQARGSPDRSYIVYIRYTSSSPVSSSAISNSPTLHKVKIPQQSWSGTLQQNKFSKICDVAPESSGLQDPTDRLYQNFNKLTAPEKISYPK